MTHFLKHIGRHYLNTYFILHGIAHTVFAVVLFGQQPDFYYIVFFRDLFLKVAIKYLILPSI